MRNITVCVSESTYRQARVWAARRGTSISAAVRLLLDNLAVVSRAVHMLREEDPNFGVQPRPAPAPRPPQPSIAPPVSGL